MSTADGMQLLGVNPVEIMPLPLPGKLSALCPWDAQNRTTNLYNTVTQTCRK